MLTRTLTAFVLAATPQVSTPTCKLAGPSVEAHWSGAIPPASTAEAPLRVVADVPLPGSASRFDYQSLAPASGRLFISHMGAGQLVVFDVRAGRVIRSEEHTSELQSRSDLVCRLLLEKKKKKIIIQFQYRSSNLVFYSLNTVLTSRTDLHNI